MTTTDPAVLLWLLKFVPQQFKAAAEADLDEALAAERRATVERITQQVRLMPSIRDDGGLLVRRVTVLSILDAEAGRV